MIIAITIGVLTAGGVFMVLQRGMVRLVLGMTLLSHATNLFLLAAGIGAWRSEPLMGSTNPTDAADPLPQAFVLTAIVISMAATAFMLALAGIGANDDTMADPLKSAPDTTDGSLPEAQSGEINALQTMGRSATHISPDSAQAHRRAARFTSSDGHASSHGHTAEATTTDPHHGGH